MCTCTHTLRVHVHVHMHVRVRVRVRDARAGARACRRATALITDGKTLTFELQTLARHCTQRECHSRSELGLGIRTRKESATFTHFFIALPRRPSRLPAHLHGAPAAMPGVLPPAASPTLQKPAVGSCASPRGPRKLQELQRLQQTQSKSSVTHGAGVLGMAHPVGPRHPQRGVVPSPVLLHPPSSSLIMSSPP